MRDWLEHVFPMLFKEKLLRFPLFLKTVTLIHGVHVDDFMLLGDEDSRFSWPWFRGLFYLLGLLCSFVSLNITLMYYNEDRWSLDKVKFTFSLLSTITCILYR